MGDVIGLPERNDPHLSGRAKCLQCGHEWVAVVPVGTTVFECPECKLERGVMQGLCNVPDGHKNWTCNCGCDLFRVTATPQGKFMGIMCLLCGLDQSFS